MRRTLLAVLTALPVGVISITGSAFVAGCASASPPSSSASQPSPTFHALATPATTVTPARADGTMLTLPPNWTKVEMTEAGLRELTSTLRGSNSEFVAVVDQWLATGAFTGFAFAALAFEDGAFVGSVNVVQNEANGYSLGALEPFIVAQLSQVPSVSEVRSRRVALPIGEALLTTFKMTLQVVGSEVTQDALQYAVVKDDTLSFVSFSCLRGNEACLADTETIIETFWP